MQKLPLPHTLASIPTTVAQLLQNGQVGQTLWVHGWIRSFRISKRVAFLAINDGSCIDSLQVVVDAELPDLLSQQNRLTTGASVRLQGTLVASPGQQQAVELSAIALEVLGESNPETYPLQKKGHTLEFLRSIAHLRARSNTFGAVFRLRSQLAQATHSFFQAQQFFYVHTPIITASDCEGAGEMFIVNTSKKDEDFFGKPAMLTVSGQLNAEALAYGLGRVYTFGPTFRAENSNTARHLAEFWMIEPEMAYANLKDDMALAEAYLKHVIEAVLAHNITDLEFLQKHYDKELLSTLKQTIDAPFAQITYTEAVDLLSQSGQAFAYPAAWGKDLQTEHERFLVEQYFKKPVVVTDYPREIKAFYMYQNDDQKTVAAMDVLVPRIGEIIGGSQREHRLDRLTARLQAEHLNLDNYQWYLDLNTYGAVPHAGFGLGFERLVMFCTAMSNIRDVIPFPRAPHLASF